MMFATTWLAITGLVAMSIPVIIHLLFRRKRKPVQWGAMRLLIEAANRNRRRSRIENVLLLAIRCLIILLVGLALAEPYLSGAGFIGSRSRVVVLVVDDGVISGLRSDDENRTDLESTIQGASQILDGLGVGDRVSVISAGKPVIERTDGPTIDHQRVRSILESMAPGNGSTDLSGAIQLASTIANEQSVNSDPTIILLGSWRQGSIGAPGTSISIPNSTELQGSGPWSARLIASKPTEDETSVLVIDSISVRRPVDTAFDDRPELTSSVSLIRLGNDLRRENTTIRLAGEGVDETLPQPITFNPGSTSSTIELLGRIDPSGSAIDGTSSMTVLIDDQSLPASSSRSVTINTSPRIRVGIVDREDFTVSASVNEVTASQWIEKALDPGEGGQLQVEFIDPISINSRSISNLDALVVVRPDLIRESGWEVLRSARNSGLFLLFVPPGVEDVHAWIDVFSDVFELDLNPDIGTLVMDPPVAMADRQPGGSLISKLDSDIDDLAAPVSVSRIIKVDPAESETIVPLLTKSGDPVLLVWEPSIQSRGVLSLLTVSPEISWTSLPIKPLMVPLFQELVRQGRSSSRSSIQAVAGELRRISIPGSREIRHSSGLSIKLGQDGVPVRPPSELGTWQVLDSNGNILSNLVVNTERSALDPSVVPTERFEQWLVPSGDWSINEPDEIQDLLRGSSRESSVSLILLAFALLLLVVETGLNRLLSHARVHRKTLPSTGVLSS